MKFMVVGHFYSTIPGSDADLNQINALTNFYNTSKNISIDKFFGFSDVKKDANGDRLQLRAKVLRSMKELYLFNFVVDRVLDGFKNETGKLSFEKIQTKLKEWNFFLNPHLANYKGTPVNDDSDDDDDGFEEDDGLGEEIAG